MVIGIGGISNAGKSGFARRLKSILSPKKVTILCQDDYVFPKSQIPKIKDHVDWETPESINFQWLHEVLLMSIECNDVVILEGIFAFYFQPSANLFDYNILLTISRDEFIQRKNQDLRWGKEPSWYIEHIYNSHIRYCKKAANNDLITIDVTEPYDIKKIPQLQTLFNTGIL